MGAWHSTWRIWGRSVPFFVAAARWLWTRFRRLSPRTQGAAAAATAVMLLLAAVGGGTGKGDTKVATGAGDSRPDSPATTNERTAPDQSTTAELLLSTTTTTTSAATSVPVTAQTKVGSIAGGGAAVTVRSITDGDTLVVSLDPRDGWLR